MPFNRTEKIPVLAVVTLCLAPLIYFLPATLGSIVLSPDDGILINLPMRVAAARMILNGEFPLWDPYIFGGMPFFAALQGGVLFPPNWLFLIFTPQIAVNLEMTIVYAVAGCGAYFYARRIGATIAGAFATGFLWQFCGFMVAPLGHISSIQAAGLLPWILWAIDGYAASKKRSSAVLVSVFIALQIFAGHPQTFVYSTFLAAGYAIFRAFGKRSVNRYYLYSLVMILVGLGLAAVQILPTLELTQYSYRQEISYSFFSTFSMPPSFLLNFFAPYATGGGDGRFFKLPYTGAAYYAEYVGYIGIIALMLALAAPLFKLDKVTVFWCLIAVLCLALALGDFLPLGLYRLVYFVPGLNLFRVSSRHLMEVDFALAVLAGRALTGITASASGKNTSKKLIAVGLGVLLITLFAVFRIPAAENGFFNVLSLPEFWCPVVMAVSGVFLLWILGRNYRYAQVLLIAALVFDLSLWGQFSGWRSSPPAQEVFDETPVISFLRERQSEQELFRVLTLTSPPSPVFLPDLQPDLYLHHDVQNAAGYDAFGLQRYGNFIGGMKEWGELFNPAQNLTQDKSLDLLNVRYLIAVRTPEGKILSGQQIIDEQSIADRWQPIAQFNTLQIYENTRRLPRAWLTTKKVVVADEKMALQIIRTGKFADGSDWDARHAVLLEASLETEQADDRAEGSVSVTNYTPYRISLKTDCPVSTVLVLAENYYPGWQVEIDGKEAELLRVNYNQRGVSLPSGSHNVEFVYRPSSFRRGLIISLITASILFLWWLRKRKV